MKVVSRSSSGEVWLVGLWEEYRRVTSKCKAGLVLETIRLPREQLVLRCRNNQEALLAGQAIAAALRADPGLEIPDLSKAGGRAIVCAQLLARQRRRNKR